MGASLRPMYGKYKENYYLSYYKMIVGMKFIHCHISDIDLELEQIRHDFDQNLGQSVPNSEQVEISLPYKDIN